MMKLNKIKNTFFITLFISIPVMCSAQSPLDTNDIKVSIKKTYNGFIIKYKNITDSLIQLDTCFEVQNYFESRGSRIDFFMINENNEKINFISFNDEIPKNKRGFKILNPQEEYEIFINKINILRNITNYEKISGVEMYIFYIKDKTNFKFNQYIKIVF